MHEAVHRVLITFFSTIFDGGKKYIDYIPTLLRLVATRCRSYIQRVPFLYPFTEIPSP